MCLCETGTGGLGGDEEGRQDWGKSCIEGNLRDDIVRKASTKKTFYNSWSLQKLRDKKPVLATSCQQTKILVTWLGFIQLLTGKNVPIEISKNSGCWQNSLFSTNWQQGPIAEDNNDTSHWSWGGWAGAFMCSISKSWHSVKFIPAMEVSSPCWISLL